MLRCSSADIIYTLINMKTGWLLRLQSKHTYRCFSSSLQSKIGFPYLFLNQEELAHRRESTARDDVEVMDKYLDTVSIDGTDFVTLDSPVNIKTGFAMSYLNLLEAIKTDDRQTLGTMCEKNLFRAFNEGL